MEEQKIFEGNRADNKAIEWLQNLAEYFHIKRAKIIEVKQPPHILRDKRVRIEVRYE